MRESLTQIQSLCQLLCLPEALPIWLMIWCLTCWTAFPPPPPPTTWIRVGLAVKRDCLTSPETATCWPSNSWRRAMAVTTESHHKCYVTNSFISVITWALSSFAQHIFRNAQLQLDHKNKMLDRKRNHLCPILHSFWRGRVQASKRIKMKAYDKLSNNFDQ